MLEPWFTNQSKRLVKAPKLYFCDTGLLCFLLNVRSADDLVTSPLRGAVFETAAYAEIRKRLSRMDELRSLFYYRDRTMEVDFVIHRGGRFSLLESKWTENPEPGDFANMNRLAHDLGDDRILGRQLVCRTPHAHPFGHGRALPLDAIDVS